MHAQAAQCAAAGSSGGASCSPRVQAARPLGAATRCRYYFASSSPLRRHQHAGLAPLPGAPRRGRPAEVFPFDQAWGASVDTKSLLDALPSNLFAFSIIPYAGFLYHLTRSKQAPPLTLFGFYFLLVFVFATIPAGIYAKTVYGTSLANVDYLHGSAEFLLTLTNLFIVVGLRQAIAAAEAGKGTEAREEGAAAGKPAERQRQ